MVDIFLGMDESESVMRDMFLSLKIGDSQKFSKAGTGKRYKFTEKSVGDRRFGKLEIYKRVGVHSVAIDPSLVNGAAEFSVSVSDLSSDQLKFYMEVDPGEGVEAKKPPPEGYKNTAERAQDVTDYLQKHQLELRLSEALQCALREKPADPGAFIAEKLLSRVGMITPVPSRPPTAAQDPAKEQGGLGATEPPAATAAGGTSALSRQDIRARASQTITNAYGDGRLTTALKCAKANRQPSAAAEKDSANCFFVAGGEFRFIPQSTWSALYQAFPSASGNVVDGAGGTAGKADAIQIGAANAEAAPAGPGKAEAAAAPVDPSAGPVVADPADAAAAAAAAASASA